MPVHDPFRVEPRRRSTDRQKLEMIKAQSGKCIICGLPMGGANKAFDSFDIDDLKALGLIDEHIEPLWRQGTNEASNRGMAHDDCATVKTSAEATLRAKSRSVACKHLGVTRSSGTFRKVPAGFKRDWRRGGRVVRDDEEDHT